MARGSSRRTAQQRRRRSRGRTNAAVGRLTVQADRLAFRRFTRAQRLPLERAGCGRLPPRARGDADAEETLLGHGARPMYRARIGACGRMDARTSAMGAPRLSSWPVGLLGQMSARAPPRASLSRQALKGVAGGRRELWIERDAIRWNRHLSIAFYFQRMIESETSRNFWDSCFRISSPEWGRSL